MKKWAVIFLLLVIFFTFGGCRQTFSQNGIRANVVQSVHVRCEDAENVVHRQFTDPGKIRLVLLCIRKLGPDFPAGAGVEAISGRTMHITLTCADGSQTTYRLKNNLYIQKNSGTWRQISPESAIGFYQLITGLTDDSPEEPLARWPRETQAHRVYSPAIRRIRESEKR